MRDETVVKDAMGALQHLVAKESAKKFRDIQSYVKYEEVGDGHIDVAFVAHAGFLKSLVHMTVFPCFSEREIRFRGHAAGLHWEGIWKAVTDTNIVLEQTITEGGPIAWIASRVFRSRVARALEDLKNAVE